MRCWNCGRVVSQKARVCGHCEADLSEAPSPEEEAAVLELLEELPPEVLAEMGEAMREMRAQRNLLIAFWSAPARAVGVSKQVTATPIPKSTTSSSVVAMSAANCGVPSAAPG